MKNTHIIFKIGLMLILSLLMINVTGFAQEEATEETPKERPARPAFESGLLFDAATTNIQPSKTLEFVLQHRFGTTENGITDLYGIWGASNIRFGLNYSFTDHLMVGFGTTKLPKMQDLQLKYNILEQTRSNSMPVTLSLYEVVGLDASDKGKWQENYKFSNRMSFFTQLIVSRRFNDMFSLQVAPGFAHFNSVDSVYNHDRMSMSFAGRIKFTPQGSFIISGDFPLDIKGLNDYKKIAPTTVVFDKPNICVGFEIATSTHAFHIFLASSSGILPQQNIMWNGNDFFKGNILIGFNLTRLWSF